MKLEEESIGITLVSGRFANLRLRVCVAGFANVRQPY